LVTDLQWHPLRPIIAAVGQESGKVYIWSTTHVDGWSAFAPDFKELEENVEYDEPEDEFDMVSAVSDVAS
jgi:COMPASS component SWD1